MEVVKNKVQSWLEIRDNTPKALVINRKEDLQIYFAKNKIWYDGESGELQELYKQLEDKKTTFWASVPSVGLEIKKIHSGLPKRIVDTLTNIMIENYNGIEISDKVKSDLWEKIEKENNFKKLLKKSIGDALSIGDGAIKCSYDNNISKLPIIEWYSGDRVDYVYKRGRLTELVFKTFYKENRKKYLLKEHYGWGYIEYELLDGDRQVSLSTIKELSQLKKVTFDKRIMWAIPFFIDENSKFVGRGASKFDGKYDAFDSLDEILSQWVEAIRLGRTRVYIPEILLPKDPNTGLALPSNSFDNQFIETDSDVSENGQNQIKVVTSDIASDKYLQTYMTYLDLCLQGLISPSTLGIDTKKIQDANASYERQMEKTTLYTRQGIIEALTDFIPRIVNMVLHAQEIMTDKIPSDDVDINVNFGEYDNPSFDNQIDTITKAKNGGIMSIETSIKELYSDSKDDKWIKEEITRLKEEQGITEMDEPSINQDLDLDDIDINNQNKENSLESK